MAEDVYKGTTTVRWGTDGGSVTLYMQHRQQAECRALLGTGEADLPGGGTTPEWLFNLEKAVREGDAEVMGQVIEICSKGEVTTAQFMDSPDAPSFMEAADAVSDLVHIAMWGPKWREAKAGNLARDRSLDSKEARPFVALIRSLLGSTRQPRSESAPQNSGA